jgi:hypothetical protein
MTMVSQATPPVRIAAECVRHGPEQLTAACVALLQGRPDEVSGTMISVLGGDGARYVLDGGEGGRNGYWPRVWAARGLLHAWDPAATAAITAATRDEAWRVREMAAKVIARVRAAAARAVTLLTTHGV